MISNKPLKRAPELQPLSHDHHHGLMLCWKIRSGFAKKVAPERIKKYADWFFKTHLIPHFELEEQYVFTILNPENSLVKRALSDHRRLKRLFNKTADLEIVLGLIEEELEAHIRFEERVLFGEIQMVATDAELMIISVLHSEADFVENVGDVFWG
jgi:hypothetical protein